MKFATCLMVVFLSSCYSVERDCENYQTGTYRSEVIIDDTLYESVFSREHSLQIETYNGKTDSATVRWINDCEAVFKSINPKSMVEKKDIHIKILTTSTNAYTFEYSYVGETNKQQGKAFKITD